MAHDEQIARAVVVVALPKQEPLVLPQEAIELLNGGGIDNLSYWDKMQAAIKAHAKYERLMDILGKAAPAAQPAGCGANILLAAAQGEEK